MTGHGARVKIYRPRRLRSRGVLFLSSGGKEKFYDEFDGVVGTGQNFRGGLKIFECPAIIQACSKSLRYEQWLSNLTDIWSNFTRAERRQSDFTNAGAPGDFTKSVSLPVPGTASLWAGRAGEVWSSFLKLPPLCAFLAGAPKSKRSHCKPGSRLRVGSRATYQQLRDARRALWTITSRHFSMERSHLRQIPVSWGLSK